MTTFDDDFVRIRVATGMPVDFTLRELGLEWPPPLRLGVGCFEPNGHGHRLAVFDADEQRPGSGDVVYHRVSCSNIDDEDHDDRGKARGGFYVNAPVVAEVSR